MIGPPGVPFQVDAPGCALSAAASGAAPVQCRRPVTRAGVRMRDTSRGPGLFLCFACDQHADLLDAARPLLPRDGEVRADRRRRVQARREGLAQHPPEPLAVGSAAHDLHARALAWANRQPSTAPLGPRGAGSSATGQAATPTGQNPHRSRQPRHHSLDRSAAVPPARRDSFLEEQMRGYRAAADLAGTRHELPAGVRAAISHVLSAAALELSNSRPLPIEVRRAVTHLQRALNELTDPALQRSTR